jgi:glycosyl transferase family 25
MTKIKIFLILFIFTILLYNKGYYVLKETANNSNLKLKIENNKPYQGVATYLINLDRARERLNYMLPKVRALPFPYERIEAIDAKLLTEEQIREKVDLDTYLTLLPNYHYIGAFGCSLSHIKAWETFLQSNYEFALILEDDVDFDPHLLANTIKQLVDNKQYWDINTFEVFKERRPLVLQELSHNKLVVYLGMIYDAGAYIISRPAAYKLLSKALPIKLPVDFYLPRAWEFDLKFTGISPQIAFQRFGHSQITSTATVKTINPATNTSIFSSINYELYKFQWKVIRILYNSKIFILTKLHWL